MKHLTIALACFLAATSVRAEESVPSDEQDIRSTYGVAQEIDRLVVLLADDVLRDIVCRVAFQTFTPRTLGSALHQPTKEIMRRIEILRGWGLVRLTSRDALTNVVEPTAGNGDETLRRWADRYCPMGDKCAEPISSQEAKTSAQSQKLVRLTASDISIKLSEIPGWEYKDGALYRMFTFDNFVQTFGFVTKVAITAEKQNHHPDMDTGYNKVGIHLSTHDVDGISERDFKLASAISDLM